MTEREIANYIYLVDAWKQHLQTDRNAVVLSDSFGKEYRRYEVDEMSDRVHAFLKENGIGKDDVVLIHLDRGVKPVIAIMGVMKAGAAFTVVESGYAEERVSFIYKDCAAKLELGESNWGEALACEPVKEYARPDDHDLALCVYTSGTSGTPKGVMHEYGQLKLEMISETREDGTWRENQKTRWGLVAPLNFVASLKIVVHFMYCGGHLYVMDYNTVKNPLKLAAFFLKNRIDETFLSPSLLRLKGEDLGPFMKFVYTGAEPANNVALKSGELINTYTMSESFFTVSEFIIKHPYSVAPIGKPRFNLDIRLLDEDGNDVPDGATGEICFYNPYCRGYINLDSSNQRQFVDHFLYTGDLAAYENGRFVLKGRRDDMIKIDGNRIEPAEIESVCRKELGLSWCAAKGFEKEGVVALYYTDNVVIDEADARQKLEKSLPYYMIPAFFVHVDTMPLTKSGKLNRGIFQLPTAAFLEDYIAPRNEFEEKLAAAMAKVLHLDRIGIKDDFFKLGGNSVQTMQVLAELNIDTLDVGLLYRGRTIEKIAEYYATEMKEHMSDEEKEAEGRKHRYPLSFLLKWVWLSANNGTNDFIAAFRLSPLVSLKKLQKTLNAYIHTNSSFNLVIEDDDGVPVQVYSEKTPHVEIETMTEKEVEELRKTFIRPFEYGECLYRIRLIKTRLHEYLFFQMSHLLSDGSGVRLMLQDIMTIFKGGVVRPTYYFAYAYDAAKEIPADKMRVAEEYYRQTIDPKNRMRNLVKDTNTGNLGQGVAEEFSVPLDKLNEMLPHYNATEVSFIYAVSLLAMEHYNGRPSYVEPVYENRTPNENPAGMRLTIGAVGITSRNGSLLELFEDLNRQQYNIIKYAYYNYDVYVEREDDYSSLTISYISDWFDSASPIKLFGKQLTLENQFVETEGRPGLNIQVRKDNGNMVFQYQYDRRYMTDAHAKEFVAMLKFASNELLEGRMPVFR